MDGVAAVLVAAMVVLTMFVAGALVIVVRLVRRLGVPVGGSGRPEGRQDPVLIAEQERLNSGLAALRASADEAASAIDESRAQATAARTDAAAAKAEAAAARAEASAARTEAQRVLDDAKAEAQRVVDGAKVEAQRVLEAAKSEADAALQRAQHQADQAVEQAMAAARLAGERELAQLTEAAREQVRDAERRQLRIDERDRLLAADAVRLAERDGRISAMAALLAERETNLAERETALVASEQHRDKELERIAGLSAEQAKAELVESIECQAKREAVLVIRDIENEARRTGEHRARHIVVEAIQRVAGEQTAESVVSVVHLPSDEMKGRIIGREGRNIRVFESVTGVNLIIDDTPEAVLLSCFDPVRREVGRLTLEKLVMDGRIHPHRIEEVFEVARVEIDQLCRRAAEDALAEAGITDIDPDLIDVIGRLRYRTSYGQNVLSHLVECANLAGIMAAELGLEPPMVKLVRRCAFLHDIGKALTHEVEGSHALIGADMARRYGESEAVVHAIEAHHNEAAPQTIEAVLAQVADSCSGGRPGARRESLEAYVRRLERIEEIAAAKAGVDKVFAMQAGREIRVMVRPEEIDDIGAAVLARDVAKQVEEELTYPGQIRVTVVRESRVTEIAR